VSTPNGEPTNEGVVLNTGEMIEDMFADFTSVEQAKAGTVSRCERIPGEIFVVIHEMEGSWWPYDLQLVEEGQICELAERGLVGWIDTTPEPQRAELQRRGSRSLESIAELRETLSVCGSRRECEAQLTKPR